MTVRWDILIAVVAYEIVLMLLIGTLLAKRYGTRGTAFLIADRSLGLLPTATTLALTVLGTVHILGVMESAFDLGAIAAWFSIAHVVQLGIVCILTGRWARALRFNSVPELLGRLYDEKVRLAVAAVMAATVWGIGTLETQGVGIVMAAITGIPLTQAIYIGFVLGLLYVIIAGLAQTAWLNVINSIILYIGTVMAVALLGMAFPGGWGAIQDYYTTHNMSVNLSVYGDLNLFLGFALVNVLCTTFFQGISQMGTYASFGAKSVDTLRKAILIALPVNGLYAMFTAIVGISARAHPEFAQLGAKLGGPSLLVSILPPWAAAWFLASAFAAILSTYAITFLAPTLIFVNDIFVPLIKPDADQRYLAKLSRIILIILAIAALVPAVSLPPIIAALMWLFSWMVPVFWFVIFGLYWKRSPTAAFITMVVSWIANCLWSFTPLPEVLQAPIWFHNVYLVLAITLILGPILNVALPGKPPLKRYVVETE
ncbi:MAG: sodium:solute symporter family protein [Desulfurococcaceae archaeon]